MEDVSAVVKEIFSQQPQAPARPKWMEALQGVANKLSRGGELVEKGVSLGLAGKQYKPAEGLLENAIEFAGGMPSYAALGTVMGPAVAPLAKFGKLAPRLATGMGIGAVANTAPDIGEKDIRGIAKDLVHGAAWGGATELGLAGLGAGARKMFGPSKEVKAIHDAAQAGLREGQAKFAAEQALKQSGAAHVDGLESRIPTMPRPKPTGQPAPPTTTPRTITSLTTPATTTWGRVKGGLRAAFAPADISPAAHETALTVREKASELALKQLRAYEQLKVFEQQFSKLPVAASREFIKTFERPGGWRQFKDPQLAKVAEELHNVLKERELQLAKLGLLKTFRQDYFGHLWKHGDASHQILADYYSKRSLTGKEGFKRQRKYATYEEGLDAGLEPLFENPITAQLHKLREIDKSIMGHEVKGALKELGLIKYVPIGTQRPLDWTKMNDKIFRAVGQGKVRVSEFYDKHLRDGLEGAAKALGIDHTRTTSMGSGRSGTAGLYSPKTHAMVTSFGGPESVMAHEIGHHLGLTYPELAGLVVDQKWNADITRLADLRWHGINASQEFQEYVQGPFERQAVLLEAYIHAPQLFRDTSPDLFKLYDNFLKSKPELFPLTQIKPSLVLGKGVDSIKAPGLTTFGEWYGPKEVAMIVDRFLSPGLYKGSGLDASQSGNPLYELARGFSNTLNQAQLGLSFFHLAFTLMDSSMTATDVAIRRMFQGVREGSGQKLGQGTKDLLKSFTIVGPWFDILKKGNLLMKEAKHAGSQGSQAKEMVEALVAAGGRTEFDKFYKGSSVEKFSQALHSPDFLHKLPAAYRWFPAFFEFTSKPVMQELVPRMKLGAFYKMAELEFEKLPKGSTVKDGQAAFARIWDSVDNRLGQMVYDNLFWNRTIKDIGMLSTRSLGWNLGTMREIGGALGQDIPKMVRDYRATGQFEITPKLGYVMALVTQTAFMGALFGYLMGKPPQSLKDYFAPRTGYLTPDGRPERVVLPTYMRDIMAVVIEGPWKVAKGKVNPGATTAWQFMENRDFWGGAIYDPQDPALKQSYDAIKFLADQLIPFGLRQVTQTKKQWQGPEAFKALPFFGITPAPSYLEPRPGLEQARMRQPLRLKARKEAMQPSLVDQVVKFLASHGGR